MSSSSNRIFKSLDFDGLVEFFCKTVESLRQMFRTSDEMCITCNALNDLNSRTNALETQIESCATEEFVENYVGDSKLVIVDNAGNVVSNAFSANKGDGDVTIKIPTVTELGTLLPFVKSSEFNTLFKGQYENANKYDIDGSFAFDGGDTDTTEKGAEGASVPSVAANGKVTLEFANGSTMQTNIFGLMFYPDQTIKKSGSLGTYTQLNFEFCFDLVGDLNTITGSYAQQGYWFYLRGLNPKNKINGTDIKGNYGINKVMMIAPPYDAKNYVNGTATMRAYICVSSSTNIDTLKSNMMSNANIYFVLRDSI